MHTLSFKSGVGLALAVVLWQAASCCCCLGGAVPPPMTPVPVSEDVAYEMRDRLNEAKSAGGPFSVEVTDRELTSYIVTYLKSFPGQFPARDMQIQFGDGYADLWATFIDIAPTDLPVYVRATVQAVDGDPVFSIVEASAGPFPVPGALRESIAQTLGESLAELDLGLDVEHAEIVPGKLILAGRVTREVPDLP
jgi:hypothetical protein